jgi:hypothetical protein
MKETLRIIEDCERSVVRASTPKRMKNAWITLARRCFDPSDREPCAVCGKFRVIAQAHHVMPLEAQYDRGLREPNHTHVWLCPNHHEVVHIFLNRAERRITLTLADCDLSEREFEAVLALVRLSTGESSRGPNHRDG